MAADDQNIPAVPALGINLPTMNHAIMNQAIIAPAAIVGIVLPQNQV